MTANFVIGGSYATVTYRTLDDSVREETEFFTAQLSVSAAMRAMGISVRDNCSARVEIVDNEGKHGTTRGVVGFSDSFTTMYISNLVSPFTLVKFI